MQLDHEIEMIQRWQRQRALTPGVFKRNALRFDDESLKLRPLGAKRSHSRYTGAMLRAIRMRARNFKNEVARP